mgnify:CR=1 FL=1|jgi:hypothetical protein
MNPKTDVNPKTYEFPAIIKKVPDLDGAYVEVPFDVQPSSARGGSSFTLLLTAFHMTGRSQEGHAVPYHRSA